MATTPEQLLDMLNQQGQPGTSVLIDELYGTFGWRIFESPELGGMVLEVSWLPDGEDGVTESFRWVVRKIEERPEVTVAPEGEA